MSLPYHLLSEPEKECLRLVHRGYKSKEIAAQRNVRPDTVDKIILSAREKLGNLSRHEAARRLYDYESAHDPGFPFSPDRLIEPVRSPQNLGAPHSLGVDRTPTPVPDEPAETPSVKADASGQEDGREVTPTLASIAAAIAKLLGRGGSVRNELDGFPRLMAIGLIAAAGGFTATAALSLLFVLDHITAGR